MTIPRQGVAVVGAGFSGSLLALHLLSEGPRSPKVFLVERRGGFGKGVAFATGNADHLLNVRAANMGAYPDRPDHFIAWLRQRGDRPDASPASFVDRGTYGAYLQDMLAGAAKSHEAAGRLVLVPDEAVSLRRCTDGRFSLKLGVGRDLLVDQVVLALGNFPPQPPDGTDPALVASPLYRGDPWAPGALSKIGTLDRVLLIGTGLTMVDVALALETQGQSVDILAISRRGLLPRRHRPESLHPTAPAPDLPPRLSDALAAFRRAVDEAERSGLPWQVVVDAFRPRTIDYWQGLDATERRRFLRHARPWWDVHRHRLAPSVADRLERLMASGRLRVAAGRFELLRLLRGSDNIEVVWRPKGRDVQRTTVRWVVNCAGPGSDVTRTDNALLADILAQGLGRPDPFGLGLDVTPEGGIIGADGQPQPGLHAIGPLTRGTFWEMTAVPDIRLQARDLAKRLVG